VSSSLLFALLLPPLCVLLFLLYAMVRYVPVIGRIFEEKPVFFPLLVAPTRDGEEVSFRTSDGLELVGTYFMRRTRHRRGVIVFCHEYLGNRWSVVPYADALRDDGFDVFAFDFRNHGNSESEPGYEPFQWVCGREVRDLKAALTYLRSRPDRDPAGFGLFGVSRGGGTAICVGADEPDIWGVVTDGAFPTRGTMLAYILRWAEIYVGNWFLWRWMPTAVFALLSVGSRWRSQWRMKRIFPNIERAASRLSPRPLLMIHGARDNYIGPQIARGLFDEAREPKSLWLVPEAKHNRCREKAPEEYRRRVSAFFRQAAPRGDAAPGDPYSEAETELEPSNLPDNQSGTGVMVGPPSTVVSG